VQVIIAYFFSLFFSKKANDPVIYIHRSHQLIKRLQSQNTMHFWAIHLEQYPTFRHYKIYHKHNSHDQYHRHRDARNLSVAIEQIKSHDAFQLNGRKPVKNYA